MQDSENESQSTRTSSEEAEENSDKENHNETAEDCRPSKSEEALNNEPRKEIQKLNKTTAISALERRLPRVNCEEHIIFVVDVCKEEECSPFQFSEGTSYSPLQLTKRVLSLYLQNKKAINPNHKYSLVSLQETPIWLVEFTNKPRDIINAVENLKEEENSSNCDISLLFDAIKNQVTLPTEPEQSSVAPPPYIVRTILLYGRSQCLPQFLNGKDSFTSLSKSPYFFIDVIYSHEAPSDDNKCEGIFDLLCDLDCNGWNYILEVGRNATKFHNLFSALLAHPLQRPSQKDAHYTLSKD